MSVGTGGAPVPPAPAAPLSPPWPPMPPLPPLPPMPMSPALPPPAPMPPVPPARRVFRPRHCRLPSRRRNRLRPGLRSRRCQSASPVAGSAAVATGAAVAAVKNHRMLAVGEGALPSRPVPPVPPCPPAPPEPHSPVPPRRHRVLRRRRPGHTSVAVVVESSVAADTACPPLPNNPAAHRPHRCPVSRRRLHRPRHCRRATRRRRRPRLRWCWCRRYRRCRRAIRHPRRLVRGPVGTVADQRAPQQRLGGGRIAVSMSCAAACNGETFAASAAA
ncbi:PE-PGRS family domain protein [Mycobacterium ulcerans str. Harvey]|uniref:PE-PGRS family domain protein n=1 Tax=Mycobacterium ulcerans str. Harvey TaxID=1299332 RepID=A0ABN0QNK2_MYCUL|nr:PE-PGRS family domain protein [Mycobacterium ulcerans str. Harvey]